MKTNFLGLLLGVAALLLSGCCVTSYDEYYKLQKSPRIERQEVTQVIESLGYQPGMERAFDGSTQFPFAKDVYPRFINYHPNKDLINSSSVRSSFAFKKSEENWRQKNHQGTQALVNALEAKGYTLKELSQEEYWQLIRP